jgi:integrase
LDRAIVTDREPLALSATIEFPFVSVEILIQVSKKIRFHDLRRTHAALMIAQNEPMKLIAERMGHSKIGTTIDTYGHLPPNMQHEASNLLDQTISGESQ